LFEEKSVPLQAKEKQAKHNSGLEKHLYGDFHPECPVKKQQTV